MNAVEVARVRFNNLNFTFPLFTLLYLVVVVLSSRITLNWRFFYDAIGLDGCIVILTLIEFLVNTHYWKKYNNQNIKRR